MATLPIVNAFDRRIGVITAVVAMIILLIAILFMKYEMADPPPEDIPMTLAQPLDVTEIRDVVIDAGGGGGGTPSEAPKSDPKQSEAVLTNDRADHVVQSGNGNVNVTPSDNGPSGDETPDYFGDGGSGGGSGGGNGPGLGQDSGPGSNGNNGGNGGSRQVINDVSFNMDYDYKVSFAFKVTIDEKGNVINATLIKGSTTTTDQVLINKVRAAVIKQVKYSAAKKGTPAIVKNYSFELLPK